MRLLEYLYGKRFGLEIANRKEGSAGEGARPGRETGCGGQSPQVEASSMYVREKQQRCVVVSKGSHLTVEIKLLYFRWLSPFFKLVQKVFPGYF